MKALDNLSLQLPALRSLSHLSSMPPQQSGSSHVLTRTTSLPKTNASTIPLAVASANISSSPPRHPPPPAAASSWQPQTYSQSQTQSQSQWAPDSIGTIVFGVVMFILAVVAL